MTEPEDLRGRTLRWTLATAPLLDASLYEDDRTVGHIQSPTDKPVSLARIAAAVLRIAWTEHAFYRIATEDGRALGEARFLPWRRDTFQARLGHLRAYRLARPATGVVAWQIGGTNAVEFRREAREASVSSAIESADAAPLLALGLLLAAKGELFAP